MNARLSLTHYLNYYLGLHRLPQWLPAKIQFASGEQQQCKNRQTPFGDGWYFTGEITESSVIYAGAKIIAIGHTVQIRIHIRYTAPALTDKHLAE